MGGERGGMVQHNGRWIMEKCIIQVCKTCGKATDCKRFDGGLPPSGANQQECKKCGKKTDQRIEIVHSLSTCKGCCDCPGPNGVLAVMA